MIDKILDFFGLAKARDLCAARLEVQKLRVYSEAVTDDAADRADVVVAGDGTHINDLETNRLIIPPGVTGVMIGTLRIREVSDERT